jgi:hypothetical protein
LIACQSIKHTRTHKREREKERKKEREREIIRLEKNENKHMSGNEIRKVTFLKKEEEKEIVNPERAPI